MDDFEQENLQHENETTITFKKEPENKELHVESNNMSTYFKVKKEKKIYPCKNCGAGFASKMALNKHLVSVHEEIKSFKCHSCNDSFDYKQVLEKHMIRKHGFKKPLLEKKQKTEPEETKFSTESKLTEEQVFNMLILQENGVKEENESSFETKLNIKEVSLGPNHQQENIYQSNKELQCKTCNKFFTRKQSLSRHITFVHEGKKPFKCGTCEIFFPYKSSLAQHISLVHEGNRPLECPSCDTRFSKSGNLYSHIRAVHEGIRPFKCNTCGLSFPQKGTLSRHFENMHGGKDVVRALKCPKCDATFTQKYNLNRHMECVHDHGSDKPFKCNR